MPRFVIIRRQYGKGCDYTIGCGVAADVIDAMTPIQALEFFAEKVGWIEKYPNETYVSESMLDLKEVQIFEIAADFSPTFKTWKEEVLNKQNSELEVKNAAKRLAADEATFEALKKKLGR